MRVAIFFESTTEELEPAVVVEGLEGLGENIEPHEGF